MIQLIVIAIVAFVCGAFTVAIVYGKHCYITSAEVMSCVYYQRDKVEYWHDGQQVTLDEALALSPGRWVPVPVKQGGS